MDAKTAETIWWVIQGGTPVAVLAAAVAAGATAYAAKLTRDSVDLARKSLDVTRGTVTAAQASTDAMALTLGVQAILALDERWSADYMLGTRGRAARDLLAGNGGSDLGEIFDFFDGVGVLFRRRVLDPEMTWGFFFQPFITFWTKGAHYARAERAKNHTIWEATAELATALQQFEAERRKRALADALPSEADMDTILREETEYLTEG